MSWPESGWVRLEQRRPRTSGKYLVFVRSSRSVFVAFYRKDHDNWVTQPGMYPCYPEYWREPPGAPE